MAKLVSRLTLVLLAAAHLAQAAPSTVAQNALLHPGNASAPEAQDLEYFEVPVPTSDALDDTARTDDGRTATGHSLMMGRETPIVLLKLDDLDAGNYDHFNQVTQLALDENIRVSYGIVSARAAGMGVQEISSRMCRWFALQQQTGVVEFWNHGFQHVRGEFDEEDRAAQLSDLGRAQAMLEGCHIQVRAFGAPYNQNNEYTEDLILRLPNLRVWFFPRKEFISPVPNDQILLLTPESSRCDMETQAGVVSFNTFSSNYEKLMAKPSTKVRGGPGRVGIDVGILSFFFYVRNVCFYSTHMCVRVVPVCDSQ